MPNKKRERHLSKKQERLIANLTKLDGNAAAAGRVSGYNSRQAAHDAMRYIRELAPEALERLGYGRDRVLKKLGSLMDAKKAEFFANKGIVLETRNVGALEIQLRAGIELAKMHGAYQKGIDQTESIDLGGRGLV
jgi:hypothetical protein